MKYTHIIWDFNGTILDDVAPCLKVVNTLLTRRGLDTIDLDRYKRVFGFPIKRYYEDVGFDFNKETYESLADEWAKLYLNAAKDCGLVEGVKEAITHFASLGIKQIILSATELGMLKMQLESLGIKDFFAETLALDNLLAVSKVELGKEWMKREKPESALFIGDTTHDYETACAMGVDCVLISKGHQCKERLSALGAEVLDNALELINND